MMLIARLTDRLRLAAACVIGGSLLAVAPSPSQAAEGAPVALVLPIDFRVSESSIGTVEGVQAWSNLARRYLLLATQETLRARTGFEVRPLPAATATADATLQAHVALLRRILEQAGDYDQSPWRGRRAQLDSSVGDGLTYLHEQAGADYLVFILGRQVKQSPGAMVMRSVMGGGAARGQTALGVALLDLRSGRVVWADSMAEEARRFASGAQDMMEYDVARKTMQTLFESLPQNLAGTP